MADDAKTPSQLAEEARQLGRDASNAASGIAEEAKDVAADVADAGRTYAQSAVDEAGKKIVSFRDRAAEWQESCEKQIAAEPVKSVLVAAAAGALLAGLLLAFSRSGSRYCE